jgi:hypothetical protein
MLLVAVFVLLRALHVFIDLLPEKFSESGV